MSLIHVKPTTRVASKCEAKSKASCKFKDSDGMPIEHYDTMEEANAAIQKKLREEFTPTGGVSRDAKAPKGITGSWPTVDGTVVRIEETGEMYTIKTKKLSVSPSGKVNLFTTAYDEEGNKVVRSIPGPAYEVVRGPNTKLFKDEIKRLNLKQRTLKSYEKLRSEQKAIEAELNSVRKISSGIELNRCAFERDGKVIHGYDIIAANKDGGKPYHIVIEDATTPPKMKQLKSHESNTAAKVMEKLQVMQKENRLEKLFDLAARAEKTGSELRKQESFMEQAYNRSAR